MRTIMEKDLNDKSLDSNSSEKNNSESENFPGKSITRREFLIGSAAMTLMMSMKGTKAYAQTGGMLPDPDKSGIEHIILVMMENRSFDHFLGWLPGADGQQSGLIYYDNSNAPFSTYPLAPDYQGCGHPDPDHSYQGGRIEYDNGACDGWLKDTAND